MHYLSEEAFIPAIAQGILTIQTRDDNSLLAELMEQVNDPVSKTVAQIERGLLARYDGGCHLPIGALATHQANRWKLRAFVGGIRSKRLVQDVVDCENPEDCAPAMYEKLESQGASQLLDELNGIA
jgi:hydroxymethylbilane synthase